MGDSFYVKTYPNRVVLQNICAAFLIRVAFMFYGLWQDSSMRVKYTDVDYYVFSDAARFITWGQSPYKRATYRYSPILAAVLTANIYISPVFGKLLFMVCDVWAGYLIHRLVLLQSNQGRLSLMCAQLWWFNPMPITICTRGNAESVMVVLVLATLYCLSSSKMCSRTIGFMLYAVSVHLKIYPVTYALPIYLSLCRMMPSKVPNIITRYIGVDVALNKDRLLFIAISGGTFFFITACCYFWCGLEFLQETYFYHLTRRDIRHNFSPYFYMLYLVAEERLASFIGLAVFIPQLILLSYIAFRYYRDLPFCFFLQTFVFVTFNKVCTSQYFLWYLSLLPVVIPRLNLSLTYGVLLIGCWFLAQALWLFPAYLLEFEGHNTFIWLCLSGLVFLFVNVFIMQQIVTHYSRDPRTLRNKRIYTIESMITLVFRKILHHLHFHRQDAKPAKLL